LGDIPTASPKKLLDADWQYYPDEIAETMIPIHDKCDVTNASTETGTLKKRVLFFDRWPRIDQTCPSDESSYSFRWYRCIVTEWNRLRNDKMMCWIRS
jgi:hypothetical protein